MASSFRLRPFSLPAGERTFRVPDRVDIALCLRIGGWKLSGEDPSEIRARDLKTSTLSRNGRRTLDVLVRLAPLKDVARFGALAW